MPDSPVGLFDRSRLPGPIHHAPWSRRFRTMCYAGSFAYEFQVGPVVVQWFYEPWERARFGRRCGETVD